MCIILSNRFLNVVEIEMLIMITNNLKRGEYSHMYDKVFYLGILPEEDLKENEIVIKDDDIYTFENYTISLRGILNTNKKPFSKKELLRDYKKGINQIVLNDCNFSSTREMLKGEKIEFVGINNHRELEF